MFLNVFNLLDTYKANYVTYASRYYKRKMVSNLEITKSATSRILQLKFDRDIYKDSFLNIMQL